MSGNPPQSAGGGAPSAQPTQKLADIIGHLRPTKQFKFPSPSTTATSLSFDDTGDLLLASLSDETLQLYNCREGRAEKTLLSKKYGCHLARFTHHSQSIIYASTKADDTIRYLSTHDNQYLRYFKGHTGAVTSLNLCPSNDTFVSSSASDHTVRLWSLSSPNPHGKLSLATPSLTAYDPTATVLAIASPSTSSILLYDLRNFDKSPFETFDLSTLDTHPHVASQPPPLNSHPQDWTSLTFTNDGKHLLLATNSAIGHVLLDAFSGAVRAFLVRHASVLPLDPSRQRAAPWQPPLPATPANSGAQLPLQAPPSFPPGQGDVTVTPDARYAIGASGGERDAVVWDIQGGLERHGGMTNGVGTGNGNHNGNGNGNGDIDMDMDGNGNGDGGVGDPMEGVEGETAVLRPSAQLPWKGRVGVLEFNPRYNMLASAEREVVMWLPDEFVGVKEPGGGREGGGGGKE
ncbi:member of Set1p complex, histone methyl transferase [Thelotrema lepadinum]|nr:member of Set1p complex, histone methyl transferase [Thelotrema lepadinum]